MKRDLTTLANETFDLLIIGGGIYGATLARDAALRGLKVALVEKGDFAGGTSSNSLKIIHGGLRYLQHADFARMRESINERRILLRIAPHLVRPMPCVMPTYGHAIKGPEVMRIALLMNDLFSADRNRGLSPDRRLPNGKIISKRQFLEIMPYIKRESLNGGAIWYDAHMINSERLLLSFLHSAVEKGATAANYVEAESLMISNGRALGVQAHDRLSDERFDIRARLTISTTGPWINDLLTQLGRREQPVEFSTAINLVLNRSFNSEFAFAAPTQTQFKDKDALINKGSRLLFFVPWRGLTLAGTAHQPYRGEASSYHVSESEVETFLAEVNSALPGADIKRDEVSHVYAGLLPMAAVNEETGDVTLQKHYRILDHQITDKIEGLLSVLTVKYTTARGVSEAVMNCAARKLGVKAASALSRDAKIWGGEMDHFGDFVQQAMQMMDAGLSPQSKAHLLDTYGSRYQQILKLAQLVPLAETIAPDSHILKAEILFGMREEMAQKLSDMMMRRTELGSVGKAADHHIESVADIMADELGWTPEQKQQEILDYTKTYQVKA